MKREWIAYLGVVFAVVWFEVATSYSGGWTALLRLSNYEDVLVSANETGQDFQRHYYNGNSELCELLAKHTEQMNQQQKAENLLPDWVIWNYDDVMDVFTSTSRHALYSPKMPRNSIYRAVYSSCLEGRRLIRAIQ